MPKRIQRIDKEDPIEGPTLDSIFDPLGVPGSEQETNDFENEPEKPPILLTPLANQINVLSETTLKGFQKVTDILQQLLKKNEPQKSETVLSPLGVLLRNVFLSKPMSHRVTLQSIAESLISDKYINTLILTIKHEAMKAGVRADNTYLYGGKE